MKWLKRLFIKQSTKSQLEEATSEESKINECVAYISLFIDANGNLKIELDFQDSAVTEFAQLFFAVNAGLLTGSMVDIFQKLCVSTDREQQGIAITEMINTMLKERIKQAAPEFYKTYMSTIKKEKDVPVVDPCNVFRTPTVGEVK